MNEFEIKIKSYVENLLPKQLGLKNELRVESISKLGQGTGNLNYLVKVNKKKFVFRINMDPKNKTKSKKEFNSLKIIEAYDFGPKAILLDDSRKVFDSDVLILEYLEGKTTNKTKNYLKDEMYKQVAKLCGRLHSVNLTTKLKKLDKNETFYGPKNQIKFVKTNYLSYLNSNIKNKELLKMINETFVNQKKEISNKKYSTDVVLSQGDFCEQNIVVNKNQYELIDFEDLELTDRSNHLGSIFSDFGKPFTEKQKKIFLKEYIKLTKVDEKELIERIEKWIPLKLFEIFLWSLKHFLKIKEGKMHPKFYETDNTKENLAYSKTMFKRCIEFGVIDKKYKKFNLEKALK